MKYARPWIVNQGISSNMWRTKMESRFKTKISLYGIISGLTFIYLILANNPSISFPIYFIIQFVVLIYIARNSDGLINIKGLFLMIPIFIISLNNFTLSFISSL